MVGNWPMSDCYFVHCIDIWRVKNQNGLSWPVPKSERAQSIQCLLRTYAKTWAKVTASQFSSFIPGYLYYGLTSDIFVVLTWSTKHLPGHVGVNELPAGFLGNNFFQTIIVCYMYTTCRSQWLWLPVGFLANNLFRIWTYPSTVLAICTGIRLQVSRYELGCCNMQYLSSSFCIH